MNKYEKCATSLMQLGDKIIAEKKHRKAIIMRSTALSLGAAAIIGLGICANALKPPKKPTAENSVYITETTAAASDTPETNAPSPIEQEKADTKPVQTSKTEETKTSAATASKTYAKTTAKAEVSKASSDFRSTATKQTVSASAESVKTTARTVPQLSNMTVTQVTADVTTSTANSHKTTTQTTNATSPKIITTTARQPSTELPVSTTRPYAYNDNTFMYVKEALSSDVYLKSGVNANDSQIGTLLMNTDIAEVGTDNSENVEIYELKGVNSNCAVVIKYPSANACPVYMSTSYEPETLGEMLADMAIQEMMTFGNNNVRSTTKKKYYTVSGEKIFNILNENSQAENTKESVDSIKRDVIIFAKLPYTKYNVSFAISKQGYITTNIIDKGATFYIGEESAISVLKTLTYE